MFASKYRAARIGGATSLRRTVTTDAKRQKGSKAPVSSPPSYKTSSPVREGNAYQSETRSIILSLSKVSKVAPNGKELLKNVSLGMYLGAKIGILGVNGSGKSTLMRILAGEDTGISGDMRLSPGIRIGYLEQEPRLTDGATVIENIEPALAGVRKLLEGASEVKSVHFISQDYNTISMKMAEPDANFDALSKKMDKLQSELDACNGWEVDRQLERAMDALRCPPNDALVANLSGGETRRVALCRLLLSKPDILLLDEPTNHLDAESVAWLERYLAEFPGTVVAVTHDRYFLDNVAGWILELDRGQGIPFEGNYSEWLKSKAARFSAEADRQTAVQKAMAQELEWMNKQAKGQQKKGKARMRVYEDLSSEADSYIKQSKLDSITIPPGPRLGGVVVDIAGVSKGFEDRLLIDNLSVSIPPGGVVGIVGGNGSGKSTLFRMIMGEQQPDGGTITIGETVVPMYVDQSREHLSADKTLLEDIADGATVVKLGGREVNTQQYCSWYNFGSADLKKKVSTLSGGERNRLQLAKVLRQSGNVLLLDEPTNDLDVNTLRCLEDAVAAFAGSVLIISHDRWFLDRLCTHILAFEGDTAVRWFEGGYSEYAEDLRARNGGKDPSRVKYRKMALS